jgi:hypothetical protein
MAKTKKNSWDKAEKLRDNELLMEFARPGMRTSLQVAINLKNPTGCRVFLLARLLLDVFILPIRLVRPAVLKFPSVLARIKADSVPTVQVLPTLTLPGVKDGSVMAFAGR